MSYANTGVLLSLAGANGGTSFPDYSWFNRTPSLGGSVQTTTAQSKYYGSSGDFNGTDANMAFTNATTLLLGSGDFTVEGWIRPTTFAADGGGANRSPIGKGVGNSNGWGLLFGTSGQLLWFTNTTILTSSSNLSLNVFQHIAACRASGTLRLFIDGTQVASGTVTTNYSHASNLHVGSSLIAGGWYQGQMNDVRYIVGTALYTGAFTPPGKLIGTLSNQGAGGEPVEDDTGAPAERTIIAVPRIITRSRPFATDSDASGNFELFVPAPAEFSDIGSYDVWARDDDAGTQYNDLYFGRVAPV